MAELDSQRELGATNWYVCGEPELTCEGGFTHAHTPVTGKRMACRETRETRQKWTAHKAQREAGKR
jgi:hypothetical protein